MDLIKTILAVGAGSFLGGAGRYPVSLAMKGVSKGFAGYVAISVIAGIALVALGYFLVR